MATLITKTAPTHQLANMTLASLGDIISNMATDFPRPSSVYAKYYQIHTITTIIYGVIDILCFGLMVLFIDRKYNVKNDRLAREKSKKNKKKN
jgi:hypothetical protein